VTKKSYYIDILPGDLDKGSPYRFDDDGVIMTKIPYTQNYHYHVTSIASYILSKNKKRYIGDNIKWLIENIDDGCYHHSFVFPFYPMTQGWVGGLAQALATSALVRYGYQDEAELVWNCLKKHCYNGTSIEEYPGVEILNGWIYGIFASLDIGDTEFYNENISHLEERLKYYDLGRWSRYDNVDGFPSSLFYHKVHIKQLSALIDISKDVSFKKHIKEIVDRWKSYNLFTLYMNRLVRYHMILKKHGMIDTYRRYKKRHRWNTGC